MDQKASAKPKNKTKLSELLPKAVAAVVVNFQKPLYSPRKEKKSYGENVGTRFKSHNGFAPTMIPAEARRNSKNYYGATTQEPRSPKISCMGQIKHQKNHNINDSKKKVVTVTNQKKLLSSLPPPPEPAKKMKKKHRVPIIKKANSFSEATVKKQSAFKSIFGGGRKSDASNSSMDDQFKQPCQQIPDIAPSLSQMRKFVSGRDTFANFDWTAPLASVDSDDDNNNKFYYYSDDEERGDSDDDGDDDYAASIPFSAPLHITGVGCRQGANGLSLEPKKEINLWKRRTMAQPKPLQLNNSLIL